MGPTRDLDPRLADALLSGVALLPAGANVVLQLAQLPVGHAVAASRVREGALVEHPIKRTRTTLAYLVIAVFGTEDERRGIAEQIGRVHDRVRSTPDDPVAYDANDPALQGWVAACLYQGARQSIELAGLTDESDADALYEVAERLGTTLRVPRDWWPATRADFDAYWTENLAGARLDEVTRTYLRSFVDLAFLPRVMSATLGPLNRSLVGVFLPATLRDELGLAWSKRRERRVLALVTSLSRAWRLLPRALRHFPLNWVLFDTRRRLATGRSVI